jgi:hypothetical protein
MGDRCWVDVSVSNTDLEKFLKVVGEEPEEEVESGHVTHLVFANANYGMGMSLDAAAAANIEFFGQHTKGDSYGASEFYSLGKAGVEYIPTGDDNYGVLVGGSTPGERWARLRELETKIAERNDLIRRMNNPLYDLTKEAS